MTILLFLIHDERNVILVLVGFGIDLSIKPSLFFIDKPVNMS